MKAVIVKVNKTRAAALTEQGAFITLRNEGYRVGDSVSVKSLAIKQRQRRLMAFASAAAALVFLFTGSAVLFVTPYSLVSLDVNPSIEYTLNRFDRVLSLDGVNTDGDALVAALNVSALKYRPVDEAVTLTIDALREGAYLERTQGNYVVLAASGESQTHCEVLAQSLSARLTGEADLTVESTAVTKAQADAAHALGTTAGKLYVVEQLQSLISDDTFSEDEWLNRSVGDIMDEYEKLGGRLPGELTETEQIASPEPLPSETPVSETPLPATPEPAAPAPVPTQSPALPSVSPVPSQPPLMGTPSPSPSVSPEPMHSTLPGAPNA